MGLLLGTRDGVYRPTTPTVESAERTLDCGRVLRVEVFDGVPGAFAATKTELYRSTDDGRLVACGDGGWEQIGTPPPEVGALCDI